jgi:hypothetical protein
MFTGTSHALYLSTDLEYEQHEQTCIVKHSFTVSLGSRDSEQTRNILKEKINTEIPDLGL